MKLRFERLLWIALALALAPVPILAVSDWRAELQEVLRSTPDLVHGRELFASCVACHGQKADGTPEGSVPVIAGQHFSVIAGELVDYRHAQRWDLRMERIADRHRLTPQGIADVAGYVSSLPRQPNRDAGGSGQWTERGVSVFRQRCKSCHGAGGEGSEQQRVPLLAGQHYEYVRRQIYDAVEGRRPNMPPEHVRMLAQLDMEDIRGVADFLSRLPPPARVAPPL